MGNVRVKSVLVVSCAPDDRSSTVMLRVIVDQLGRREDLRTSVWFLRSNPEQRAWRGARVVDSLRSWLPSRLLDLAGLHRAADALRGLRLRWWNLLARPDIVILDDGLGERVLTGTHPRVIVARRNRDLPEHAHMEPPPVRTPDLVLAMSRTSAGVELADPPGPGLVLEPKVRDLAGSTRFGVEVNRRPVRNALGLPPNALVVVGWGTDGWIDGPDVFVRALWVLEHHHGVAAHGLWLGEQSDPRETEQLRADAERCGVGDRLHFSDRDNLANRCCGDAVFLPYRSPVDAETVVTTIASGVAVVTFLPCSVDDELVRLVPYLDVEAAATELATALAADRVEVFNAVADRLDLDRLIDRILWASAAVRPR